jgi:2-dehydro-3-deoxygluconokinase
MLRLSPPDTGRLDQVTTLDAHVAGSELNVAVALAALGVSTRWISAVPDTPLGRRVTDEVRAAGVDCDHIAVIGGRLGVFFVEFGIPPRPTSVWYDRAGSSFTELEDFDASALDGARMAAVSGVTPALGESSRSLTERFVHAASEVGAGLCVDVNHRSRLWSGDEARAALEPLVAQAEVVVCSRRDAEVVFGITADDADEALLALRADYAPDAAVVVLTLGERGAVGTTGDGELVHQPAFRGAVRDRIGGGDAFTAGLLWGLLDDAGLAAALARGAALAALKRTVAGDLARFTPGEVLAVVADPEAALLR